MCSIDFYSRYSSNGPTSALNSSELATVSSEIGAENLYSYSQLQRSTTTYSQDAAQSDTDQIYERISNLDLQLESEEAQPYSEPVKANTLAA